MDARNSWKSRGIVCAIASRIKWILPKKISSLTSCGILSIGQGGRGPANDLFHAIFDDLYRGVAVPAPKGARFFYQAEEGTEHLPYREHQGWQAGRKLSGLAPGLQGPDWQEELMFQTGGEAGSHNEL
jgi:hypothetical protein